MMGNLCRSILVCVILLISCSFTTSRIVRDIQPGKVKAWATNLKKKLVDELASQVTQSSYIEKEFAKYAELKKWDPVKVLDDYKKRMTKEIQEKEEAVRELTINGQQSFQLFYKDKMTNNNSCFHRPELLNDQNNPCFMKRQKKLPGFKLLFVTYKVRYLQTWRFGGDDSAILGEHGWAGMSRKDFANYTFKLFPLRYLQIMKSPADDSARITRSQNSHINSTYFLSDYAIPNSNFQGKPVWLQGSAVHVPEIIYERDPKILEGINASARWFDDFAKQNRDKVDEDISYQFFCGSDGYLRFNPAEEWTDNYDKVDLYDCRLQPWYVNAVTSPKQVLILLDTSGSMLGQRMEIAKQTVEMILDTLSERDYFNIIVFNEKAKFATNCFKNGFIQATLRNKKMMRDVVESPVIKKMAKFNHAMELAFGTLIHSDCDTIREADNVTEARNDTCNKAEQLVESIFRPKVDWLNFEEDDNDTGTPDAAADCNQVIMLLTDGAPETHEELMKKLNPDKRIRIFGFLIGVEVTNFEEVRWMSCNNRGYFVHISSLDDVQSKIHHFIDVLSRPLALHYVDALNGSASLDKFPPPTWTGLHFAQLFFQPIIGPDAQGAMPTVTVSQPLIYWDTFNTKLPTRVIGVAGTHIPLSRLKQSAPDYELGGYAYTFAVDGNAYVVYHPQHRYKTPDFEVKPNFNSIDILEAEVTADNIKLENFTVSPTLDYAHPMRRTLVDGSRSLGEFSAKIKQAYDFGTKVRPKHVFKKDVTYYLDSISDSRGQIIYSLGLVVPKGKKHRVQAKKEFGRQFGYQGLEKCLDNNNNWRLHEDWFFCRHRGDEMSKERAYTLDAKEAAAEGTQKDCSKYEWLVRNSFMNVKATCNVEDEWNKNMEKSKDNGVLLVFLVTHAGLTRFLNLNLSHVDYSEVPDENHFYRQDFDVIQAEMAAEAEFMEAASKKISRLTNITGEGVEALQENGNVTGVWDALENSEPLPNTTFGPRPRKGYMHFVHNHKRGTDEEFYRRTIEMPKQTIVFDLEPHQLVPKITKNETADPGLFVTAWGNQEASSMIVKATQAIYLPGDRSGRSPVGVVGFEMLYSNFSKIIANVIGDFSTNDRERIIYILDENGYVIFTTLNDSITNPTHAANFFGLNDMKCLMAELVKEEHKIFNTELYMDYQALCKESSHESRSSRLINPIYAILNFFVWAWRELSMLIAEYSVLSLLSYQIMPSEAYTHGFQGRPKGTSCDMLSYHYKFNRASKSLNKVIKLEFPCNSPSGNEDEAPSCQQQVMVSPIAKTNLVLVLVHQSDKCSKEFCIAPVVTVSTEGNADGAKTQPRCQLTYYTAGARVEKDKVYPEYLKMAPAQLETTQPPVELDENGKPKPRPPPEPVDKCPLAPSSYRYRRDSTPCFHSHKLENFTDCSGTVSTLLHGSRTTTSLVFSCLLTAFFSIIISA